MYTMKFTYKKSPYSGIEYPEPAESIYVIAPDGTIYIQGSTNTSEKFFYDSGVKSVDALREYYRSVVENVDDIEPEDVYDKYTEVGIGRYVTSAYCPNCRDERVFSAFIIPLSKKISRTQYKLMSPVAVYYEVDGGMMPEHYKKVLYDDGVTKEEVLEEIKDMYKEEVGGVLSVDKVDVPDELIKNFG